MKGEAGHSIFPMIHSDFHSETSLGTAESHTAPARKPVLPVPPGGYAERGRGGAGHPWREEGRGIRWGPLSSQFSGLLHFLAEVQVQG